MSKTFVEHLNEAQKTYTFKIGVAGDLPEGCGSTDEPPCPVIRDLSEYIDQRIYNSLDECESVCPSDSIEITTLDDPDGIGKHFIMYCAENN